MKSIQEIYNSYLNKSLDERISIGKESYNQIFLYLSEEFNSKSKRGLDLIIISTLRTFIKADKTIDEDEYQYLKNVMCFDYSYNDIVLKLEKDEIIKASIAGLTMIKRSSDLKLQYNLYILGLLVCVSNGIITNKEIEALNNLL